MRWILPFLLLMQVMFGVSVKYFVGSDLGFGIQQNLELRNGGNLEYKLPSASYILTFNGGVQQFWDPDEYIGGRILGQVGAGLGTVKADGTKFAGVFDFLGAADLMLDFLKGDFDFGVFGGFEYGLIVLASDKNYRGYKILSETHSAFWRFGASMQVQKGGRLELMYKAPVNPLSVPDNVGGKVQHRVLNGGQILVGYKMYIQ